MGLAPIIENVRQTVQHVAAAQPMLAGMIADGKVKLAGGVYDIATGKVTMVSASLN
jgi:carbonic anhydrase